MRRCAPDEEVSARLRVGERIRNHLGAQRRDLRQVVHRRRRVVAGVVGLHEGFERRQELRRLALRAKEQNRGGSRQRCGMQRARDCAPARPCDACHHAPSWDAARAGRASWLRQRMRTQVRCRAAKARKVAARRAVRRAVANGPGARARLICRVSASYDSSHASGHFFASPFRGNGACGAAESARLCAARGQHMERSARRDVRVRRLLHVRGVDTHRSGCVRPADGGPHPGARQAPRRAGPAGPRIPDHQPRHVRAVHLPLPAHGVGCALHALVRAAGSPHAAAGRPARRTWRVGRDRALSQARSGAGGGREVARPPAARSSHASTAQRGAPATRAPVSPR
jgi:hypothetical protein